MSGSRKAPESDRRDVARWFVGLCLRFYPSDFRQRHGEDLGSLYRRLYLDVGSTPRRLLACLRILADAAWNGTGERLGSLGASVAPALRAWAPGEVVGEVRIAGRGLLRRPGLSLSVVLVLGLGLGAGLLLFTVADAVLFQPLPYDEPDLIVRIVGRDGPDAARFPLSYPDALDFRDRARTLVSVSIFDEWAATLTGGGEPERLTAALVDSSFFDLLGTQPVHGRGFVPAEDEDGSDRVVVLTDGLFRRRFAGDPSIVGQGIVLDDRTHVVVGVLGPEFEDPGLGGSYHRPVLYRPLGWGGLPVDQQPSRDGQSYDAIARLRPGVSQAHAEAELMSIAADPAREHPDSNAGRSVALESIHRQMVGDTRGSLFLLLAAVGCVLAVALANVLGLLAARALERRDEAIIRRALGAGRGRLIRLRLIESGLLAAAGCAVAAAVAVLGLPWVARLAPDLPRLANVGFDGRAVAVAALLAAFVATVCGVVPGLLVGEDLRRAGRGTVGPARGSGLRLRSVLVVAEVALALVLVVGAGLLAGSLKALHEVDAGVDTAGVLTFELQPPRVRYPQITDLNAFYDRLLARLDALPGVEASAATNILPFTGSFEGGPVYRLDLPEPPHEETPSAQVRTVTPSYFDTFGVPLLVGSGLPTGPQGDDGTEVPAVVSRRLVELLWPTAEDGFSPVGERIAIYDEPVVIVGVVGDIRHLRLDEPAPPRVFVAREHMPAVWQLRRATVALRTTGTPTALVESVRRVVAEEDPELALSSLRTADEVVSATLAEPRLRALVFAAFGALALVLAAVGIHALLAQALAEQRREMAVRLALGASARDLTSETLRRALRLTAAGLVVGLFGSLAMSRGLESVLFGVAPFEPGLLAAAAAVLLAASLLAAWRPARRAAGTDPMELLRDD